MPPQLVVGTPGQGQCFGAGAMQREQPVGRQIGEQQWLAGIRRSRFLVQQLKSVGQCHGQISHQTLEFRDPAIGPEGKNLHRANC